MTQPSPDGTQPAPVTTYGYDEVGNKVSQTDALLRVTRWEYDALGRVTKRILPGLQEESFTYDAVGNVATHVTFNGETIAYAYDALNRLITKTLPGGNAVSYTYTPTGQVDTVTDVRGPTRHTYDARDRLTKVEHPEGWVVEYGYDEAGNRTSVSTRWPGEAARVTAYAHDGAGRIVSVTGPGGEVTTFGYDEAGNRTSAVLPNGITTTWAYDARNRLTRIEHKTTATGAVQAFYESAWNAQGLRATQRYSQSPGQGCLATYTYDRLGRLTQAVTAHSPNCPTIGSYVYTYDAVGNRLTEYNSLNSYGASTYADDANDRLTAITGSAYNSKARSFAYDAAGNVTRQVVPTASTTPPEAVTDYRWDAEGRLVGVTTPDYREIAYAYDAEGQLVGERVGSEPTAVAVTRYLADKNLPWSQILEERDGAGALKVAYQFAGTQLLKQERGGQALWSHGDHLSTRLLTDATGTVLNRYVYSPFGELQAQSGTAENVHLFAGERYDAALGHTYLRARWMNPVMGRFLSVDRFAASAQSPITLNRYLYAESDPIGKIDPTGLFGMADVNAGISGVAQMSMQAARLFANGAARQGGNLMRQAGQKAEELVGKIIKECLTPNPKSNIPTGAKSKRTLDFLAELESVALKIESKSKIPLGGESLGRLKKQVKEALDNLGKNEKLIVVGVVERPSDKRLERTIKHLKDYDKGGSSLFVFNGGLEFLAWVAEQYGELCLGL